MGARTATKQMAPCLHVPGPCASRRRHVLRGMIQVSADVMRSVNEYDVVVVGAGQVGLSAAYALAKAGPDRERYVG